MYFGGNSGEEVMRVVSVMEFCEKVQNELVLEGQTQKESFKTNRRLECYVLLLC
jgi:hypothetical protein